MHEYLTRYTKSPALRRCSAETRQVEDRSLHHQVLPARKGNIKVSRYDSESDYGAEVSLTFQKFRQGAANEHRFELPSGGHEPG